MNVVENIKQLGEEARHWAQHGFPTVSREVRRQRYENGCKICDRFNKRTGRCQECNCFMAAKSWLATVRCPIGRWQQNDVIWFFDFPWHAKWLMTELLDWASTPVHPILFIRTALVNAQALEPSDWPIEDARNVRFLDQCRRIVKIFGPGMEPIPPLVGDVMVSRDGRACLYAGRLLAWHVSTAGTVQIDHLNDTRIMQQLHGIYRVKMP